MRSVVVTGPGTFELQEIEKPVIKKPTDVIVKVTGTTVCGSDVHLIEGHIGPGSGFSLGHEFVGIVEEAGTAVETVTVGDRVIAVPRTFSGFDSNSRNGQLQADINGSIFGSGQELGGGQAEYVRVNYADQSLAVVPEQVSDLQAVTVGDNIATGFSAISHAINGPGQTLVVFGAGPVGLSAVHTSKLFGPINVVVVDTVSERLQLAETFGATRTVNPIEESVAEVVAELTAGQGAEAIVEAAGVQQTIATWPLVARPGAHIALIAIPGHPVELPLGDLQNKNVTIWTGLGDALNKVDYLLKLIAEGVLDPSPLFSDIYQFDDIERAIQDVIDRKPGLIKPFVKVS